MGNAHGKSMGKIALDTMQANGKALRLTYRRSLETDPLKQLSAI